MRVLLATLFCLAVCSPVWAAGKQADIALTFDDLPALTRLQSQAYVDYANDIILRGLRKHHFPAIGFVNEGKLDELIRTRQIANLRKWRDAGMSLGNHTFSHEPPNVIGAAAYVADIARGEVVTRELLEKSRHKLRWFRHPYLETGLPLAEKEQIDTWLAKHDYRIAPVTMENSDWEFSEPYDDAIARRNPLRAAAIKAEYLAHSERVMAWYQKASEDLLGRQIAFVMLLHVNRLNADSIEEFAGILDRRGLHPVSLEKAMRDPAYLIPDPYVGADGVGWLERWSLELRRGLPWDNFPEPSAEIKADYHRVDDDH